MLRKIGFWLLLAVLIGLALRFESPLVREAMGGGAVKVIDGDSFRLDGREVRLAGIDSPEYRQLCHDERGAEWPCGREARAALERLLSADGLACTKQAEDRYGRALAHCRTRHGDVAAQMARQGWALGARDPRFDERRREMDEARKARRGIWKGAHEHPADWRKRQRY